MALKEMQPRLQLTFEEYTETWSDLIEAFYQRGFSSTQGRIELDEDTLVRYSSELSCVMVFMAMTCWRGHKRIATDVKGKVGQAILEQYFDALFGEASDTYYQLYQKREGLFLQLAHNITNKDPGKRQMDAVGFARYSIAQISTQAEEKNIEAIKELSIVFMEAISTFIRLTSNSSVDLQGLGKTKFIVQK